MADNTKRVLRVGDMFDAPPGKTHEIATLDELRAKVKELKITVPPKIKLSAQWGRKWIEYIGKTPNGELVFLDNGKW